MLLFCVPKCKTSIIIQSGNGCLGYMMHSTVRHSETSDALNSVIYNMVFIPFTMVFGYVEQFR